MKIIFTSVLIAIATYFAHPPDDGNPFFTKMAEPQLILKPEMEKYTDHQFKGYEEKFFSKGDLVTVGNLRQGIVKGMKGDTIYDISLVFRDEKCISVRAHPDATFYREGETIYEKYKLGWAYSDLGNMNASCIKVYFVTIEPFNVDTLNDKFFEGSAIEMKRDSLKFCQK